MANICLKPNPKKIDKMRRRFLAAAAMLAVLTPCLAQARDTAPASSDVVVTLHLDLYDGDKLSKGFADGLRDATSNDSRFTVVDTVPADGVLVVMKDALQPQDADGRPIAGYEVNLKLGSGKFLKQLTGYCDQKKLDMCGRVVAEDIYTNYSAWAKKNKK